MTIMNAQCYKLTTYKKSFFFFNLLHAYTYGKCAKISNTSVFCLVIRAGIQNSCLITRARIHNLLVLIANREDLGLIWVYCLSKPFGQATSIQNFRTNTVYYLVSTVSHSHSFPEVVFFQKKTPAYDQKKKKTSRQRINLFNSYSLASFLWGMGKQCRPRPDAAESGV